MSPDPFDLGDDEPATAAPASSLGDEIWPPLRWRGDLARRHLTAGTLLVIASAHGGAPVDPGVSVSTVELELRRIAHKYRGRDSSDPGYAKTINGDKLFTDSVDIRSVIHGLVFVSGAFEYVDTAGEKIDREEYPDETTRIRLTDSGNSLLESAYSAATRDGRFSHIDLGDPILELDVTSGDEDGTLVETLGIRESTLPLKRTSSGKPGYRAWLMVASRNPVTWAVLKSGLDPSHPRLFTEGALEGTEHIIAAFNEAQTSTDPDALPVAYWGARVQAEFLRPLGTAVLGGGPDGIWIGKPLKPDAVHADVVALAGANEAGFGSGTDMERRSSLAWELYDESDFSVTDYTRVREELEAAERDANTITVTHVPDLPDEDADEDSDIDEKLRTAELTADKRGVMGLKTVEKLIMKKSSDALFDSALGRSVANPHDAGKVGRLLRVRCDYVLQPKHPNDRRACDKWAVGGSTRCELHGGMYISEEEIRSVLVAGQTKLIALSSKAIDVLADLMLNSTNPATQMGAAKLILDKAGFAERIEINVDTGPQKESPADVIASRLARLSKSAAALAEPEPEPERRFEEFSVLDAEVVEVTDDE